MDGHGKKIGRPRVVDRPGFGASWAEIYPDVQAGRISHEKAARRLGIGYASLLRLLRAADGGAQP